MLSDKKCKTQTIINTYPKDEQQLDAMLNYGSRDILLIKCKTAIEELHIELKVNQEQKEQLQKEVGKLEEMNGEMKREIEKMKRESDKKSEVIKQINERNSLLECLKEKYSECKTIKDKLGYENEQQSYEIQELHGVIQRKEQLEIEWENTIRAIQKRIGVLEQENDELRYNNEKLVAVQQELKQMKEATEWDKMEKERQKVEIDKALKHSREVEKQLETIQQKHEDEINQMKRNQMKQIEQSNEQASKASEKQQQQYKEIQQEYNESQSNLNNIKKQLELQIEEQMKEKDVLHGRINELSRLVNENEEKISEMNRTFQERNQVAQKSYLVEMNKLQQIIEDQTKLIESFESIMEKEKAQFIENIEILNSENNQLKKNNFMQRKLSEAQEELNQVSELFLKQEQNQNKFGDRIGGLEQELEDKDRVIEQKTLELKKSKLDQQKTLGQIKILMKDLEQITNEVYAKEQQYKQVKQENDLLKQNRSELNKIIYSQFDSLGQSQRKKMVTDREEKQGVQKFEDSLTQIPNRQSFKNYDIPTFKYEAKAKKDSFGIQKELNRDKLYESKMELYKTISKDLSKNLQDLSEQSKPQMIKQEVQGEEKEKVFLDKFKNIITNLEEKLEYMQNELNSSD